MDFILARQLRRRPSASGRILANSRTARRPLKALAPFELLYEGDLPAGYELPGELGHIYGRLGFPQRVVYSNFVSSMDGVVALGSTPSAGSVISGRNPADRFLMGLLRACADAVLLGAGTLRATPGHLWTADHIFPAFATLFAQLREVLGRKPEPRLVVITASGNLDISHLAIAHGATIATTAVGASKLRPQLPDSCDLIEVEKDGVVDVTSVLAQLRSRGYDVLLTEGGPHLMGELIAKSLLDEAFVTISPVIAGRDRETRLGMVAGMELIPASPVWSRLLSVRRQGDFLFLRYRVRG